MYYSDVVMGVYMLHCCYALCPMPYALRLISLRLRINLMRGDIQRKKEVRLILFNQGFLVLL
jgi:hypothetical protein